MSKTSVAKPAPKDKPQTAPPYNRPGSFLDHDPFSKADLLCLSIEGLQAAAAAGEVVLTADSFERVICLAVELRAELRDEAKGGAR
jgi:hypothetical protein